ncbi:MAG: YbaN family protein [Bacillota bacterium]
MKKKLKKIIYIILGSITLALGSIGIVLPLLPTTPFLLLSAYFYLRSSKKLYHWLINHKVFGIYIYSYITYKAINVKTKIYSISLLWITLIISMIIVKNIYLTFLLIIIGLCVSIHLLTLKTMTKKEMLFKKKKQTIIMN